MLGCGYTGRRVAGRLIARGLRVTQIRRAQVDFTAPGALERLAALAEPDCVVLHSVPSLEANADATLLQGLQGKARRVVYLSTTGVYGDAHLVDETTPIAPRNAREQARANTEAAVQSGTWSWLILRPAAIYGPDRGVHVSLAEGRYQLLGDGSNFISRIHVDDLAALAEAALLSDLTGAYPAADLHPCPAREVAAYCSAKFGLPMPTSAATSDVPATRRNNRRVDARATFAALGVEIQYPSYREGLG